MLFLFVLFCIYHITMTTIIIKETTAYYTYVSRNSAQILQTHSQTWCTISTKERTIYWSVSHYKKQVSDGWFLTINLHAHTTYLNYLIYCNIKHFYRVIYYLAYEGSPLRFYHLTYHLWDLKE